MLKPNRKKGIALLGASVAVLAATSQIWTAKLGIGQWQGLLGMALVYAALLGIVLHRSRQPPSPQG